MIGDVYKVQYRVLVAMARCIDGYRRAEDIELETIVVPRAKTHQYAYSQ